MSRTLVDSGITYLKKVPDSWNVFRIKDGFNCSKELVGDLWASTQLLSLTTTGVKEKDIDNPNGKLPESFETYQYVKKNNIVMCLFDLDCSAVFSGISKYDGMISPAYRVLECKENMIEPRYAGYYFNYISYDRKYMHYSKNIRFTLSFEEFSSLPMIYPSIEEQTKIANYLDNKCSKIDKTIEDNNKAIELLKEYKNNYISDVINDLKNSSSLVKLKYLGGLQNGISAAKEKFESGNGTFVNYGDVYNNNTIPECPKGIIDLTDSESNVYSLKRGDILFTRTSETIEEVGMSAVCVKDYPNSAFSGFVIRFRPYEENMLPEFYRYYFNLPCHRDYFAKEMNLVTRASLSQGLLGDMKVILPSLEKQKDIAIKLDNFSNNINKIIKYRKKIIEKLEEYKRSLIYEVVTGKKEV